MPRPTALPPELPQSFPVALALTLGVTRDRLEGDGLERIFHGARMQIGEEETDAEELTAWQIRAREIDRRIAGYASVMPERAFLCGPTAAHHWDIPVSAWVGTDLHIGVWRPRSAPRRPGVQGHQFTPGFVRVVDHGGVRVTDPASTWASLGGMLTEDELVAAADRVIRVPRHPGGFREIAEPALGTIQELRRLSERKGRPGAPALRNAVELARDGAASPPETQIRLLLGRARLPDPTLDFDVRDRYGRFLGCSELAYPELKVAIEYESDGHLTRAQLVRDIDKYQDYAEAGWSVVRLTWQHVYREPGEAVRRVRAALRSASAG